MNTTDTERGFNWLFNISVASIATQGFTVRLGVVFVVTFAERNSTAERLNSNNKKAPNPREKGRRQGEAIMNRETYDFILSSNHTSDRQKLRAIAVYFAEQVRLDELAVKTRKAIIAKRSQVAFSNLTLQGA